MQVISECLPGNSIQVTTWELSGQSKKKMVQKFQGGPDDLSELMGSIITDLVGKGWISGYNRHQLDESSVGDGEHVACKITANVEVLDDLELIIDSVLDADWMAEEDATILIGQQKVKVTRSRRKAGETRPLRFDTIVANVPVDGRASALLAILAERHGGKLYDDKANLVKPAVYYTATDFDGLEEILAAFGMKRYPLAGVFVRPTGQAFVPAVF